MRIKLKKKYFCLYVFANVFSIQMQICYMRIKCHIHKSIVASSCTNYTHVRLNEKKNTKFNPIPIGKYPFYQP